MSNSTFFINRVVKLINFSLNKLLQCTPATALALALAACGGGDSSTTASTATTSHPSAIKTADQTNLRPSPDISSMLNAPKITLKSGGFSQAFSDALKTIHTTNGDAVLKVLTDPKITFLNSGVHKNSADQELMSISDPAIGTRTFLITNRNANGDITRFDNFDTNSPLFSSLVSMLGNRIGMLCVADDRKKQEFMSLFPDANIPASYINQVRGQYVYLSDDFSEVDPKELVGKNYSTISDCSSHQVKEFDNIKKLTNIENPSPNGYSINWKPFTEEGHESTGSIERAKAYKAQIDGKAVYAIVRFTSKKSKPAEYDISFSIGLE